MSLYFRNLNDITRTSARIFGNRIGNNLPSGWKELRKMRRGLAMLRYYQPTIHQLMKGMPGFETPRQLVNKERIERRLLRGKTPTKKGQGKQALKRAAEEKRLAAKAAREATKKKGK
ncbi:28S ribosomal protein S33, mitochondrial [Balamuthia mandrillaris]